MRHGLLHQLRIHRSSVRERRADLPRSVGMNLDCSAATWLLLVCLWSQTTPNAIDQRSSSNRLDIPSKCIEPRGKVADLEIHLGVGLEPCKEVGPCWSGNRRGLRRRETDVEDSTHTCTYISAVVTHRHEMYKCPCSRINRQPIDTLLNLWKKCDFLVATCSNE